MSYQTSKAADRKYQQLHGEKLPFRYWWERQQMRDALLRRLMKTQTSKYKHYRYAVMYGASWQTLIRSKRKCNY